jgi:RNA polymerase primary sigma factor
MKPSYDMTRIRKVMDEWKDRHNEEPSEVVLAEMTGLPAERIRRLLPLVHQWQRLPRTPLSLDAVLGDTQSSLHELVADHDQLDSAQEVERNDVWEAVARLPERMQIILKRRYVEGYTLDEVGKEFGLTRARIKQLQDEALEKMRAILRETYARERKT